jgi:hypothetical protein
MSADPEKSVLLFLKATLALACFDLRWPILIFVKVPLGT